MTNLSGVIVLHKYEFLLILNSIICLTLVLSKIQGFKVGVTLNQRPFAAAQSQIKWY